MFTIPPPSPPNGSGLRTVLHCTMLLVTVITAVPSSPDALAIPPPDPYDVLLSTWLAVMIKLPLPWTALLARPPPPSQAALFWMVLSVMTTVPSLLKMPPPKVVRDRLSSIVL